MTTTVPRAKPTRLIEQQERILTLIAQGYTNEQIADILEIKLKTLYARLERIERKTGIKSRVLLAFYAFSRGLVSQEEIRAAIARERKA